MMRIKEWWAALDEEESRFVWYYDQANRSYRGGPDGVPDCAVCGHMPSNNSPCHTCREKYDLLVHKANMAIRVVAWEYHHQVLVHITDKNYDDKTVRSHFVKANMPSYDYAESIILDRI